MYSTRRRLRGFDQAIAQAGLEPYLQDEENGDCALWYRVPLRL